MAEPIIQPTSPLEASSESIKLSSSNVLASSTTSNPRLQESGNVNPPILTPNLDSREAFLEFCKQYAPYMQYNALLEREIAATTEVISAFTSRTDENGLLMEPLSTATAHRAESLIPKLKECASGLPATFQSIDKMQELINKLKDNVAEAQQRVDDAEASFGSSLSVSKLFGVFSRKEKTNTAVSAGALKVLDTKAEFERMRAELKSGAPSAS